MDDRVWREHNDGAEPFCGFRPALRPGRFSTLAANALGCLAVFAVIGVLTRGISSGSEKDDARPAEEERPHAQLARAEHGAQVWSLAFTPSDSALASATITGEVWLQDLDTGVSSCIRTGAMNSARSLAFSSDGRVLAVAGGRAEISLFDVETRDPLPPLVVGGATKHVAASPVGPLLAIGSRGGELSLWNLEARSRLFTLEGHAGGITALAFSGDGSALASGDSAGAVKIWDVARGRLRASLAAHSTASGVTAVAFSSDGRLLATAGLSDPVVRLWHAPSGQAADTVSVAAAGVNALALSPNGALLALAGGEGTVSLWGIAERRALGSLGARQGVLRSIGFSKDGRTLATGGTDGSVCLWTVAEVLESR